MVGIKHPLLGGLHYNKTNAKKQCIPVVESSYFVQRDYVKCMLL